MNGEKDQGKRNSGDHRNRTGIPVQRRQQDHCDHRQQWKNNHTALIYHICKTAGLDCALVGNIGYSFARQVAEDPKPLYVAEISSFQLDDIETFRPDVAVLLNITEDHLDRYDYKFENYISSKFRIAMNQTSKDHFIYNLDDEVITEII